MRGARQMPACYMLHRKRGTLEWSDPVHVDAELVDYDALKAEAMSRARHLFKYGGLDLGKLYEFCVIRHGVRRVTFEDNGHE
jgi:hypothetical protein